MPILHVRNVPEGLYARIKQQAAAQNRSISAHVITLLTYAAEHRLQYQSEILNGIQRRRFFTPVNEGAPNSTTLLREDRER
ncbi:MAG: hypothetical protein MUO76_13935 [Anaerolineaceae bacterium]|nr:hypothetical protein [Anaerolineaceae bacterium]